MSLEAEMSDRIMLAIGLVSAVLFAALVASQVTGWPRGDAPRTIVMTWVA
jgi:hypothetical protein